MANKTLFSSFANRSPAATVTNNAGGRAYAFEPKHALAQMAATGTFGNTYYTTAESQLGEVLSLVASIKEDEFLAKLAVYSRQRAAMKDMPAALLLALSSRDTELMHRVFDRVVDNGRILRTLFQMTRSGLFVGASGQPRTGLSSSMQRAFRRWLNDASTAGLLSASIGSDPSLRDILRMARPAPKDNQRRALFGWLTGKELDKWAPASVEDLPAEVHALKAFRAATDEATQLLVLGEMDGVRWDLLADTAKGPLVWAAIARKMGPQALRMNLNTLMRHGAFDVPGTLTYVADRLSCEDEVRRGRQFPYQYFAAYLNADEQIPSAIRKSLHQAAEIACGNVPVLPGPVVIGLDTSGSMGCSVTGWRGRGASSKMRCVDVAALFAAAIMRRNPDSVVIPFDTKAYQTRIDSCDSILSIGERLSKFGGGGTNCALPLQDANSRMRDRAFAGVILVSDNESWVGQGRWGATGVMDAWSEFVKNQKRISGKAADPKLVCIDIQPSTSTQAIERTDILNIGGFNDSVFQVVENFMGSDQARFVSEVEAIEL